MKNKYTFSLILTAIVFFVSFQYSFAQENKKEQNTVEKYNPGEMIIGHVIDSHEWHILSVGEHHVSIPLPIIIYSKVSGWNIFSSFHLSEGETYKNFKIIEKGNDQGKIIEIVNANLAKYFSTFKDSSEFSKFLTTLPQQKFVKQNRDVLMNGFLKKDFASLSMLIGKQEVSYKPLDLSITKNVIALWASMLILIWVFVSMAKKYKTREGKAPKGLQSLLEPIVLFIRDDVAKSSIGVKYERYLPYLLTIFFFILFNNLFGIIPIPPFGANITGNLAITGVLAIFTFVLTTFSGNKHYWKEMVNPDVPWWLKFPLPLMPLVEISGMFIKPFVLMVRLFANILAGHIVPLGFYALIFIFGALAASAGYGVSIVSVLFAVFLGILELLVAFIQAYVFTLLSALYFGLALEEHH